MCTSFLLVDMSLRRNRFELLSNDLVHEICDYLSTYDSIKCFKNLNRRFSLLISQRLFQVDLSHLSKRQYDEFLRTVSLAQLSALKVSNKWTVNAFVRLPFQAMKQLRMLTLAHINYRELRRLFESKDSLVIMQQLNTFKIQSSNFNGLDRERLFVLKKIFSHMPKLRLCQIPLIDANDLDDLTPSLTLEQLVLEYCTMVCLDRLLSYIPNVHSLTVRIYTDLQYLPRQSSIGHSSAVDSSIRHLEISTINNIPFSQVEDFFRHRFHRLKVFQFSFKTDAASLSCLDYIDDQRWESVLHPLPVLEQFHCCIELPIHWQTPSNPFENNPFFQQRNWLFAAEVYTYSFNTILRLHTKPYPKRRLDIIPSKAFVVNNNIYPRVRDLRILIDSVPIDISTNVSGAIGANVTSLTLISNRSYPEQSFLAYLCSIIAHHHLRHLAVQLDNCSEHFLFKLIETFSSLQSLTLSTYQSWSKLIELSSTISKSNLQSLTVHETFLDFNRYRSIRQLFRRLEIVSVSVSSTEDCYRFLTLLFIGNQSTPVERLRSLTIKCNFDEPDSIANWIRSNILRKLSYKCTTSVLLIWL